MNVTRFALRRPVTVLMMFTAVVLIGLISWNRLPLELLPSLNYPQITVMTSYENVAPPEIESLLSRPIEEAVGTVQGVTHVTSTSREGVSMVTLDFEWGVDMNVATLDVKEKLDTISGLLPKEAEMPVVIKFDPQSAPIMTVAVSGEGNIAALTRTASQTIKRDLERVPGVALARISGMVEREILVSVDQGRLFAYGIPISRVVERLKEANFNFPGGRIEQGSREIRIRTMGQFEHLRDLEMVVIAAGGGTPPVFLRDVARIQDTYKERESAFLVDGRQGVGIAVYKQADSNTVQVADEVSKVLDRIEEQEEGVSLSVVYNQATFIKEAISDLEWAGILGGVIAFFVLLFFLGSLSTSLIITTAIPVSVLGAFVFMYMTGISLNVMSLGGLALGVGLLVDNGIVILENIHRHREKGAGLSRAVVSGSEEMGRPVMASTLAHIVVFLPIIFLKGMTGRFFFQLALTISFSLTVSIFVALVLNPLLYAGIRSVRRGLGRKEEKVTPPSPESSVPGGSVPAVHRPLKGLSGLYRRGLAVALSHRKTVIFFALSVFVASIFLLPVIGREFIPQVDQGSFLLQITTPPGSRVGATGDVAVRAAKMIGEEPDVKNVFVNIGYDKKEKIENALGESEPNKARLTVVLNDKRKRSVADVVRGLRPRLAEISGVRMDYLLNRNITQFLRQQQKAPDILEIKGPDIPVLRALTTGVLERLGRVKGLKDISSSLGGDEQEMRIVVDRKKAAGQGLTVKQIGDTLKTAMEGEVATQYHEEDQDIDIRVRLRRKDRTTLPDLRKVLVYTPGHRQIPLGEVAYLRRAGRLRQIRRIDSDRVSVISANVSGVKMGDILPEVSRVVGGMDVPRGYSISISSMEKEMNRSFQGLGFALLFSVALVYMLLASLFESFLYPLIIMFSVPLAVIGVFAALFLTGKSVSLGVYIGGIMLGGIVVNNAIILVDYINTLRKRGLSRREAIIEGGMARLRPILMTALTTTLGLVPLAMQMGKGSEIRSPLAITVIGGLTASTLLTLIVIPVMYAILEDLREHLPGNSRRK